MRNGSGAERVISPLQSALSPLCSGDTRRRPSRLDARRLTCEGRSAIVGPAKDVLNGGREASLRPAVSLK
jgi:hypothetical protein